VAFHLDINGVRAPRRPSGLFPERNNTYLAAPSIVRTVHPNGSDLHMDLSQVRPPVPFDATMPAPSFSTDEQARGEKPVDEWFERRSAQSAGTGARGFNGTSDDSQFQRDRARIIHCASFRSLQSKTQVLGLGESDFYRTRLTHSLEVAQIGSGICEWLRERSSLDDEDRQRVPSFSLIEAICLAHDIGHSPFGHGGEVAMNTMMREHGGFEANGQTLRILARLGEYSADCGLDLTRRTMLGTIKYPALYSQVHRYPDRAGSETTRYTSPDAGARAHDKGASSPGGVEIVPLNIDHWTPPKCLYDDEADVLDWLLAPFNTADRERFLTLDATRKGHLTTRYKPFDTSIMELADDIAYGVHDLEDALALGLVERAEWQARVSEPIRQMADNPVRDVIDKYDEELFDGSAKARKHAVSRLVGYLIRSIDAGRQSTFSHPLLDLQATMQDDAYRILLLIKDFVMQHVILRPELQMLQYKGQRVIVRLFEVLVANPERLLPHDVQSACQTQGRRAIADYLSAMTDVSAGKLYHKLHSPSAGSIFDRA